MRRKYREPEPMRRVAVYEDEESMQPRKRRILFPVLITLFSVIFVVSAAVLVIELIVNPYVTDKNVGEIQKIYSEAGDTESVAPVSSTKWYTTTATSRKPDIAFDVSPKAYMPF